MRFLGVTETCDLGALYMRLKAEGHEVRVTVSEPLAQGTMLGLIDRAEDWRAELDWVGRDGIIVFEAVSEGFGAVQDSLRRDGYRVIGGSAYGDRLENDRGFAQDLLEGLGFPAGLSHGFSDVDEADAFIAANPGRYVLKFSGPSAGGNYVGELPDGSDVRAMLRLRPGDASDFILMKFIDGIEMGVGAYFNGERFLRPACLDWEHKRFFAGDIGELTGEMGTVVTFDRSQAFFDRTLKLFEPELRAMGHVGYVNLNTIVNAAGIHPLEFTCRFGYPGFAVLTPLQATPWAELLTAMAERRNHFEVHPGFCTGVVITTPPFPYSRHDVDELVGLPVVIDGDATHHLHFGEVGLTAGSLVTSGVYGWTMVATGTGETIAASAEAAYRQVARVFTPQMRYRLDIGDKLAMQGYAAVETLGLLD